MADVAPGRMSPVPHPGDLPTAAELRGAIPKHCFVKSLGRSLFHFVRDMMLVFGCMFAMRQLMLSEMWRGDASDGGNATFALGFAAKAGVTAAHWLLTGFFMWCLFVVGHDCGHTTFSEYSLLNDVVGHLAHGALLVPFWPWQRSHRLHHLYHNDGARDMSHWWFHQDGREMKADPFACMVGGPLRWTMPFIGWPFYVLFAEGGHFTPFGGAWQKATNVWFTSVSMVLSRNKQARSSNPAMHAQPDLDGWWS
jgi:omega-3 fatty acid desaturase (delta-15 desaturase)